VTTEKQNDPLLGQVISNITVRNRSNYLLSKFDIPAFRLPNPFTGSEDAEAVPEGKEHRLGDYLRFYDEEFLNYAYRGLLKRAPDEPSKTNLLRALRVQKKPRVDILHRMVNSKECAPSGITIIGLERAFFFSRLSKLPVIGFIVRLLMGIRRLSTLKEDQEHMRGLMEAARQESSRALEAARREAYQRDEILISNQNKVSGWLAKETGNKAWPAKRENSKK
jgi:hypothetical protein